MFKLPPLPRTIRACEEDLKSADPEVRREVGADLARVPSETERARRTELLLLALADEDAVVRRKSLVALSDLNAKSAVPRIVEMLKDPEIEVRQMAVMALGETADPQDQVVLGRLASLLRAGDPSIRYQALLAHSSLLPEEAAEDLERACSDQDPEIRELAIRLVDELLLGWHRPVPSTLRQRIEEACRDSSESVRLMAQLVAAELLLDAPRSMIEKVVRREFRVKEPRDEQSAIELAGRLAMRQLLPALKRRALGILGVSFDPFRWVALTALARLGEPEAIEKMMRALRRGNYMERTLAAQGLSDSNHAAALPLLQGMVGQASVVDQEVLGAALKNLSGNTPAAS